MIARWGPGRRRSGPLTSGLFSSCFSWLRQFWLGSRFGADSHSERQLALQERQFQTTLRQLEFSLFGAAEQKWIDEFRDIVSELFALSEDASLSHMLLNMHPNDPEELKKLTELKVDAYKVISKIWLHLGEEHEEEFTNKLRIWFFVSQEEFDAKI
jgi:hypothetical protein